MGCTDLLRVLSHGLRAGQTVEVCTSDTCIFAEPRGGTTFIDIAVPPARGRVMPVAVVPRSMSWVGETTTIPTAAHSWTTVRFTSAGGASCEEKSRSERSRGCAGASP